MRPPQDTYISSSHSPRKQKCVHSHGRRGTSGGRCRPASGALRAGLGRRRRDRGPHRCHPGRGQNLRRRQLGRLAPRRPRRDPSGGDRQGASIGLLGAAGRVRRGARAAIGRRNSLGAHLRAALEGALSPPLHCSRYLSMRLASDSRSWHCSALHCSAHSALLCIALSTLLCTAFSLLYTAPLLCRFSSPCKPRACAGFTRLCTAAAASLPTSHRLAQDHQTAESMHRITRLNHSPHPAPALCSAQRAGARPRRSVHTLFRACSVRLGRAPWFASII